MQDVPNSNSKHLQVDMEDILDPDERTNDIDEERRAAEHDSEFYDGDRDQDGDTMPLPPIVRNNGNGNNGNGVVGPGGGGPGGGNGDNGGAAGK